MTAHDAWHVAVLGTTLFAAAGILLLLLGPLVPGLGSQPRPSRRRAALALAGLAGILLLGEWLVAHRGSI